MLLLLLADTMEEGTLLALTSELLLITLFSLLASTEGTRSFMGALMDEEEVVVVEVVAVVAVGADDVVVVGSLSLLVEFFFFTSCSALLISSRVTPCVERRVSRTRLACAFRCVSLSSSRVGGTKDLRICPELGVVVGVPVGLVGGDVAFGVVGVCTFVVAGLPAVVPVLPNTRLLVAFLSVRWSLSEADLCTK